MERIKILQVCYSLKAAGIETFVTNIQKGIDTEKYDVHFLLYKAGVKDLFYRDIVEKNGGVIENASADKEKNFIFRHIKQRILYYKVVKNGNYDVVHIHASSGLQGLEVILARIAGIKTIFVHSHTSKLGKATKFNWLKLIIHKIGLLIIEKYAVEKLSCSEVAAKYLFPWSNDVKIISNGIQCDAYAFSPYTRKIIRNNLGIGCEDLVMGHIGSFTEAKNHEFLLEVFCEIQKKKSDSHLILVGDGPLRKCVMKKYDSLQLQNVHFMGIRPDCNELLMAMDCVVFPSFWEGLPIVIVEAQSSGVPCLLSDTITKQVELSDLLVYYSLKMSPMQWADKALEICETRERNKYALIIGKTEFDISYTVEQLQRLYDKY